MKRGKLKLQILASDIAKNLLSAKGNISNFMANLILGASDLGNVIGLPPNLVEKMVNYAVDDGGKPSRLTNFLTGYEQINKPLKEGYAFKYGTGQLSKPHSTEVEFRSATLGDDPWIWMSEPPYDYNPYTAGHKVPQGAPKIRPAAKQKEPSVEGLIIESVEESLVNPSPMPVSTTYNRGPLALEYRRRQSSSSSYGQVTGPLVPGYEVSGVSDAHSEAGEASGPYRHSRSRGNSDTSILDSDTVSILRFGRAPATSSSSSSASSGILRPPKTSLMAPTMTAAELQASANLRPPPRKKTSTSSSSGSLRAPRKKSASVSTGTRKKGRVYTSSRARSSASSRSSARSGSSRGAIIEDVTPFEVKPYQKKIIEANKLLEEAEYARKIAEANTRIMRSKSKSGSKSKSASFENVLG